MKVCFHDKSIAGTKLTNTDFIDYLKQNHEISEECNNFTDIIFNMSAFEYKRAEEISKKYAKIPLVNYVWDYYKFAHEGKHSFDWKGYAKFLKKSTLVIVPSSSQQLRLKELLNIDSVVVKTGHTMFDAKVTDDGFVLDHMRWYPEENERWIVTACETQMIRAVHTEHREERSAFEKLIASCRFLACGYREASTGGLTILEGLWLGKPTLLSNSPYQGGKDYLGDFATYFQYDNFADCKRKIKEMYDNPPKIDVKKARKYILDNFTYDVMAKNIENEFLKII